MLLHLFFYLAPFLTKYMKKNMNSDYLPKVEAANTLCIIQLHHIPISYYKLVMCDIKSNNACQCSK